MRRVICQNNCLYHEMHFSEHMLCMDMIYCMSVIESSKLSMSNGIINTIRDAE